MAKYKASLKQIEEEEARKEEAIEAKEEARKNIKPNAAIE